MICARSWGLVLAAFLAGGVGRCGEAGPARGPLQEGKVVEHLRVLTLMAWGQGGIRLDREGQTRDDPSAAQAAAEMEQRYLASGMAPDQAARLAQQMARFQTGSGADGAFRKMASVAGANRQSSSMSGEDCSFTFSGGPIEGKLARKKELVELELLETAGTERKLTLRDDGEKLFDLELGTGKGGALLKLTSKAGESFRAEWQRGGEKRSVAGKSFAEAYSANRAVMEDDLFPFMKELGIGVPPTPMSPEIVRAVLAELRPVSAADRDAAAKLFAQLDSESFQDRENASRDLGAGYGRFHRLIAAHLARKDLSEEVRGRLELVVERNPEHADLLRTVAALKLLDDTGYLRALLDRLPPADREPVAARLAKLEKR